MAYMHLYNGSVTSGGTDGAQVSEGAKANPIVFGPLNAADNEVSTVQALAIRCETGYVTGATTTISPSGTNAAKIALSTDNSTWGAYGDSLILASGITATNTLFYIKAKSTTDENPISDTTIALAVFCSTVEAT
jgi:hypothetical protein